MPPSTLPPLIGKLSIIGPVEDYRNQVTIVSFVTKPSKELVL